MKLLEYRFIFNAIIKNIFIENLTHSSNGTTILQPQYFYIIDKNCEYHQFSKVKLIY